MLIKGDLNKEKENSISFFVIYAALTSAVYILPALIFRVPYVIAACLMLASLVIIMFKDSRYMNYSILILFATLLLFFSNMLFNQYTTVAAINDAVRNVRFFLPVLWGCFALKHCNAKQQKTILILMVLIIGFVFINTMVALEEDPWIARLLAEDKATSSKEVNAYRLRNVGGYSFSYMMGIVTLVFSYLAVKVKPIFAKIVCTIATVLCFYYIIQTMYTTLLLLCSIGVLLILFFNIKSRAWRGVVLGVFVLLWFSLSSLFGYLSDVFGADSLLSTKFSQMQMALTGEGIEALGSRPMLMGKAVEHWLSHPIFGAYSDNHSHSLVFEYLQQNGLAGLGIWVAAFAMSWKLIYNTLKEHNIKTMLFNTCMGYLLVLSVFNDTRYTFEITIAAFFIVPLASAVFCKKEAKVENENV